MNNSLLLEPSTAVVCPKCDQSFSVEQGFAKQALEVLASSSATTIAEFRASERADVERRAQELAAERDRTAAQEAEGLRQLLKAKDDAHAVAVQKMKSEVASLVAREASLQAKEAAYNVQVEEAAGRRADELVALTKASFESRLKEKDVQVAELRSAEVALRTEKAKLQDRTAALELEVARKLDAGRGEIEARVRAQEHERSSLREAEYQKTISDMRDKLADAQRKAEQGSQQMQGEVLELAIEDGLRRAFPLDKVEEVKKGVRGGDVIHRVSTRAGQTAAIILWETKRAKDWSPQWVTKLKDDTRQTAGDVGVLVTMPTAIPKDWVAGQVFGLHEGVWVTTWGTALQLAEVLRSGLLDCHQQRVVSTGKGEKMEAVYDYVTSARFAHKLRAVFETFQKMSDEFEAEKSQTTQRWARREKQLQSGMTCLLGIGGDIQGLAQQELPELELVPFKLTGD